MFTLSAKGAYGLSAVLELAFRRNQGPVQIRDIADSRDIPQQFLEQILVVLKRAGIVRSKRGAQGGYTLADDPSRIAVLDILEALEGSLDIAPDGRGGPRLAFLWESLEQDIRRRLSLSLADLSQRVLDNEGVLFYDI